MKPSRQNKQILKKIIGKLALIIALGLPLLSFGATYQYDPKARLSNLQATYPGGVQAIYSFCTDKLSQKLNYLKNLGVNFSDIELKEETYRFLGSCIYGQADFEASQCGVGVSGVSCQAVTLPLDLVSLESLAAANSSPSEPINISANLYS